MEQINVPVTPAAELELFVAGVTAHIALDVVLTPRCQELLEEFHSDPERLAAVHRVIDHYLASGTVCETLAHELREFISRAQSITML